MLGIFQHFDPVQNYQQFINISLVSRHLVLTEAYWTGIILLVIDW